jgi:putative transposase
MNHGKNETHSGSWLSSPRCAKRCTVTGYFLLESGSGRVPAPAPGTRDRFGITFLPYCLMTNHVHLLAVPEKQDSLARAIGEAHRRYTRMINFRENVRGFLFQGRFSSCPVDRDTYLIATMQYIASNPVKAGMVKHPWEHPWSSAKFRCGLVKDNPLVQENPFMPEGVDWRKVLSIDSDLHGVLEKKNR